MMNFIESKLRPPVLRSSLIKREHLMKRLTANLDMSTSFICAGPGWGKTTAAAEFLSATDRASVWYDLDSSDADIAVFFQYLVRAVRTVAPDFGQGTLEMVRSSDGTRPEQLADLFLYELSEDVSADVVIVLDNIHHVFAMDWSAPLLYRVIELLPENIHLILLARTAPQFTFARVRSKQIMDQINTSAMAFTRAEAARLLESVLASADAIDRLLDRTQGWIAGLQIIRQALEADPSLGDQEIDKIITESEAEIFDFFARRVYHAEPAQVRSLLMHSALPRRITPELLTQALGVGVTVDELQAIVRENIFLSRVAGESDTFIYHPLFRDFLCKQLEHEATPAELSRMHSRLADYYASHENVDLALDHFFKAGDELKAARALLASERQLLANGLTLTVSKYFPRFHTSTLEAHPQLYNLMGDMHVIEGKTAAGEAMFQSALTLSRTQSNRSAEAAALAGLAHAATRNHNFKDAIKYAEQAERCAPEHASPLEAATLGARVKNVMGAVRIFEGEYTEANDLMEEALMLAHEAGDQRLVRSVSYNMALPAYMEGDFRRALRYFARSPISGARSDHGLQMHPDSITLYLNRASIYTARGELDLAESDLERAAEIAEVFKLRGFLPAMLECKANVARERRQFDEADQLYNSALNEYRRVDADPVKTDLYYEKALLELRRGEYDQALDLINLMIVDRKESNREIEEALARQMRGRILLEAQSERVLADADASEQLFRRLKYNYYLAIGCYLRARALSNRDLEGGRRSLIEFFALAERFDYRYFIDCEESYKPALGELCRLYSVSSEWQEKAVLSAES
jgi:ATP/maltotriose-dependent transcriptional regulator MalT